MERDPRDDRDFPLASTSPEALKDIHRRRFYEWWDALSPPGCVNGFSLEKQTAFATWMAAHEECCELVDDLYDSCKVTNELVNKTAYEEACYAIYKLSGKKAFTFNLSEYIDWLEYHCENSRREYDHGTVTIAYDTPENPPRPLL